MPEERNAVIRDIPGAAELIHCAYINLDNMAKISPLITKNPFYLIVKEQLKEGLEMLGRDVKELTK